jgi:hypothetical protein
LALPVEAAAGSTTADLVWARCWVAATGVALRPRRLLKASSLLGDWKFTMQTHPHLRLLSLQQPVAPMLQVSI